jgi:hypothetical protein
LAAVQRRSSVIAEDEIDTVFDDRAIAKLLAVLKLARSANANSLPPAPEADRQVVRQPDPGFTETDRQRFADSIRTAVRCYLAESARTNWPAIAEHIRKLYRLLVKAEGGNAKAVAQFAKQVEATDAATRTWLERCFYRELTFPSEGEIANKETRFDAMRRLESMLCYGWDWVEGRKRPSGRRSRSRQLWLRVPQNIGPGRPLDLAARELVQQLALTYLEATGKRPPPRVHPYNATKQPFFQFVVNCFELLGLESGNVADLINEREQRRRKMEERGPVR